MTGFEPRIFGIGCDCSTNCATTSAPSPLSFYLFLSLSFPTHPILSFSLFLADGLLLNTFLVKTKFLYFA